MYNKAGLLAFNQNYDVPEEDVLKQPGMLISGALMAFTGFFKEILGTKEKLTNIITTGYEFLFSELPGETGTIIILASKVNFFLSQSLKKFSKTMPKEIIEKINKPGLLGDYGEKLNEHIIENFPYLTILKQK